MIYDDYDLPYNVEIDGERYAIRDNCEHRLVLKCIKILNDADLPEGYKQKTAFITFYEDYDKITNYAVANEEMYRIIGGMSKYDYEESKKRPPKNIYSQPLMNWEKDYKYIAPAVSRVIGYDIRTPNKHTHWFSFVGAYMEIGSECYFNQIVSIRAKKQKGKKLEKHEEEFYREHYEDIILPQTLTAEEEEFLNSDW